MILVIGATGTIGQFVIDGLGAAGTNVRALVRSSSVSRANDRFAGTSTEIAVGSADDRSSLDVALSGVERVFLAMRNTPDQEAIERTVIDACAHAGVSSLVKVSAPYVDPDVPVAIGRMHGRVEFYAQQRSLRCAFLRPFGFMQNLLGLAPQIARAGAFIGAAGTAPFNFVDVRDIADVAVHRLLEPAAETEALVLTGPESINQYELADRMRHHGINATYIDLAPTAFEAALLGTGLPPWLVGHLAELQALAVARPEVPNTTIERITGRPARTIDSFLVDHAQLFTHQSAA
jgi:uncharacterized protein YbjT (DUF2867 family)